MTTEKIIPIHAQVVGTLSCQRNSYLQRLDAQVVSCERATLSKGIKEASKSKSKRSSNQKDGDHSAAKDEWLIECDDSVLFPEGGGQPSDHGTLTPLSDNNNGSINVEFVERQGLHCIIHSSRPLELGTSVRQEVDFARRWDLMQQHTGQHLLTAVMNTYEDLKTLGWGMGSAGEMSYVDLPRKPSEVELATVQDEVNEIIRQNMSITVETPDEAYTDKLPDDYDQQQGVIRVIKIGDLDNNTCCGTHLQQTSHIGLVLLGPNQPNSGGRTRQYFIAGNRALNLATTSSRTIRTIAKLLSSSTGSDEVMGNVTRLQDTVGTLKKREAKLIAEIAKYEMDRVKAILRSGKNAFVYRPEPGMEFINVVAAGVRDDIREDKVLILASGEGKVGGAVLILGKKELVDDHVAKTKEIFPAIKGGGKSERWQGKMPEWKNGDVEKLQAMIGA